MEVLILGGTGVMGAQLLGILADDPDAQVTVTSRKQRADFGNVHFVLGNARNSSFLDSLLSDARWDVIVDFMNWNLEEFLGCHLSLLDATNHYVFLSSSRVYAKCEGRIAEDSPRLLEMTKDADFLATNRYALRKAREEDLITSSGRGNYTIIRPYVTYGNRRLQLGIYEKEEWLYRVLNDKPLIISEGVLDKTTTMTYGRDVALGIYRIMQTKPLAGAVHITTRDTMTWMDVLKLYASIIKERTGKDFSIYTSPELQPIELLFEGGYNTLYDRKWNRLFDNSKAESVCGHIDYLDMRTGLSLCLKEFLQDWVTGGGGLFLPINAEYDREMDRLVSDSSVDKEKVLL